MDNMNFKPNSYKSKEEKNESTEDRRKLEKVVSGAVKTKKKNEISKFANVFISEDVKDVKSYLLMDVAVPAFKKLISDLIIDGVNLVFFGKRGSSKSKSVSSKVSYRSYYDNRDDDRRDEPRTRTGYSYDDVILETRGEAEEVLFRMDEAIDAYGSVSVADMFDLVGSSSNFTDNRYGWTKATFRNAKVTRVRDGYLLDLPRAIPI